MTSRAFFRASKVALGVAAALAANSVWAQAAGTPPPAKQGVDQTGAEEMNTITVTGSRTITDVLLSPTPITSVDVSRWRSPRPATRPTR